MIERFLELLSAATAAIPPRYFNLPVAGRQDTIYRERVYCYELYHQMRILLENDGGLARYTLDGEVDKRAHPIIERSCAPDFLFHVPGEMENMANLVIIEVKPVSANAKEINEDFSKLAYFVGEVGYQCGVELVYGDNEDGLDAFMREFPRNNRKLQLFWHKSPGTEAFTAELQK